VLAGAAPRWCFEAAMMDAVSTYARSCRASRRHDPRRVDAQTSADFATISTPHVSQSRHPRTYYVEALSRRADPESVCDGGLGQVDLLSHPPSASAAHDCATDVDNGRRERSRWRWASPSTRGVQLSRPASDEHSCGFDPNGLPIACRSAGVLSRKTVLKAADATAGHRLACTRPAIRPPEQSNSAMTRTMMTEIPTRQRLPRVRRFRQTRGTGHSRGPQASGVCGLQGSARMVALLRQPRTRQMSRPVHSRS